MSEKYISIVISNYNKALTVGKCIEAALNSKYGNFEVIVVDDCSKDNSVDIIKNFPCRLIRLDRHSGASKARNRGAAESKGDIIFFLDADCLLQENTLSIANRILSETTPGAVLGGTYTEIPHDSGFFSLFQSIFINYSETKNAQNPDYLAAHAMIIDARVFRKTKGFPEDFMPILEDVEFSHRLKRAGYRLIMSPEIQVRHIFNFSFYGSIKNAARKSKYWTMYSLKNRDLLADSGTASRGLKTDVASSLLTFALLLLWAISRDRSFLYPVPLILFFNTLISIGLLRAFYRAKGPVFAGLAFIYYTVIYPLPVASGAAAGIIRLILKKGQLK